MMSNHSLRGLLPFLALVLVLAFPLHRAYAADPAGSVVEAEGYGESSASAEAKALRHAVEKVVGMLVDAKTMTENEEVLSDKVFTASNAFVTDYDRLEGPRKGDDGLWFVKVRATVARQKLQERVTAAVSRADVDGRGLWAEMETRRGSVADVAATLPRAFAGMPFDYLEAKVLVTARGNPSCHLDAVHARLTVDCEISVNHKAYCAWAERARQRLAPIADVTRETKVFGRFEGPDEIIAAARARDVKFGDIGVFILEPSTQPGAKLSDKGVLWRINWYGFNEDKRDALRRFDVGTSFDIRVSFVTAAGGTVMGANFGSWHGTFQKDGSVAIAYPGLPFSGGAKTVHRTSPTFEGFDSGVLKQADEIVARIVPAR